MATTHLGPDLRATGCTVLGELVLAYLEQALDLAAAADRDARLEELETLIEGARAAQRLWMRLSAGG